MEEGLLSQKSIQIMNEYGSKTPYFFPFKAIS